MEERVSRGFGDNPPTGFRWQLGKNAASISFVRDAEAHIETCTNPGDVHRLKEAIAAIKDGTLVLDKWLTAEEFLNGKSA